MNVSDIERAFPGMTAPALNRYYADKIALWRRIFEGRPPWEKTKKGGLYRQRERRELNRLNTAKVLCDCFSDLTFSEQVEITIDQKDYQKYIDKQLNENGFWKNIPFLLSNAYALGGCCIKLFVQDGKPRIDYVHADKFLPIEWNGREIVDGVFLSETTRGEDHFTLMERQSAGAAEYKLFRSADAYSLGSPVPLSMLYEGLPDTVRYETDAPMFAYFRPSVSNPFLYDVPLGISIYAGALDTLKALDVAFDSFAREFILGKKRIIVPASSIQTVTDTDTGETVRYFDSDDEAFVALETGDAEGQRIIDNTVALRVEEHVAAINALLNLLCFQVGLSAGSLSFDGVQGMKTATEVVSQESKTQRTIRSNKNLLTETIERVVHSLIALGVWLGDLTRAEYTVTVGWADNVIIDDNTLIDNTVKLYGAGLIDLETAIARVNKCDEKTAAEMAERIRKSASVGSADFF
ncbi:MAG: phage portal protein [Bacteroides sp.]|nr:phage portal protein [Eubacterium sp.]MCM1419579.1 phage portal protein [Roseburia sp.]MCM1463600.1 phage portal protein [Bacteroides sp.]